MPNFPPIKVEFSPALVFVALSKALKKSGPVTVHKADLKRGCRGITIEGNLFAFVEPPPDMRDLFNGLTPRDAKIIFRYPTKGKRNGAVRTRRSRTSSRAARNR